MKKHKSATKQINRILFSLLTGAAVLLLSACQGSPREEAIEYISEKYSAADEKQLIVYTSHKEEVYLPIIREFENRTGIWVEIHAGGTAEMFQQVKEASESGACDIMFGGGIESYEAQKDLFMPYTATDRELLDDNYVSADDSWTPFTELPIVFIYNNKLVSSNEVPRTWNAIFNKRWKGEIAFADPNKSGTSYTIISTMEQLFNEEPESLVPRLYEQLDGQLLASSGDIIPLVSDGTYLIGITLEETARKYMQLGYDIDMVYPTDGTSAVPDGCAIVKNSPHSFNAGKFIDFVVEYNTQLYAMDAFYRRPVRTDIDQSKYESFNQMDFDIEKSAREEDRIFSLWNEVVGREGE